VYFLLINIRIKTIDVTSLYLFNRPRTAGAILRFPSAAGPK